MDAGPGPGSLALDGSQPLNWQFLQCFGERTPGEEIQEADIISAIEFDASGQHLATGDRGGRVVLFERVASQGRTAGMEQRQPRGRLSSFEFRYMTEFQSHEPEFDYLKSFEIEEKINKVRWVNQPSASRMILSTNDKTIKLWKVYEKKVQHLTNYNTVEQQPSWSIPAGGVNSFSSPAKTKLSLLADQKLAPRSPKVPELRTLRVPQVASTEVVLAARCRRKYANAHTYHVNSIALSSDQETFITADDLRVNLWHLDISDQAFNVVDMKPANMDELTEVITVADFHPRHCHTFAFATSKGAIRMADLRASALLDNSCKVYEEQAEAPGPRSFFTELLSSMSDLKFSRDGRYMLARDFMTLKLWDVNMESSPVATYPIHEHLKPRLCDLYENDCIFDKFDCAFSGDGSHLATGTYSNCFRALSVEGMEEGEAGADVTLEASRDPQRKRLQTPAKSHGRFGLSRGNNAKRAALQNSGGSPAPPPDAAAAAGGAAPDGTSLDFNTKLLHLAWHPEVNLIAAAASNSLYMYYAR
ncbi:protein phosphatase 2A regulatory subunit PR55 [Coccomyxa subellipsoidea C-169]|uniref:Serine/threonine-protein phosphatase 2A 55 kDa regulatory subunit B n=1 Tax=Coccomyxa subellipsoidea (strain C-169) TaxID=574566 RepID=I0YSN1_COCSC|nr:protein phosphatase 2A regulatory subunit PR55 [Coccomyxa subellipsoidea C-169]EIE21400.1 protein phosphatase 2A regulatory subunit PR55 [Coccomyxa subellipsoidea C-169]|eukprot:XP_005645944.1 protein phosphatase 2A regulatory subunit PR55 [Coccomyxa subellipsoidea C-169]